MLQDAGAPQVSLPLVPSGPASDTSDRRLIGLGILLVAVSLVCLVLQLRDLYSLNIFTLLGQSAIYALCAWLVTSRGARLSLWVVIGVAVALRIGPLLAPPYLSTDIFRYVWDGRVQGAGINPYLYVPNDPALAFLRDDSVWPNINRATYATTIYPPAAQMIFFLATRISGSVLWMKSVFVLFEAATVWAVIRLLDAEGLPRNRILIYAWCPLTYWEFAGSGHVDAAMTTFVAVAILASRRQAPIPAGIALGLAILTKFFPIVLAPALWRRWDWRLPTATVVTIILGYLVYIKAGWSVLGFLSGYVGEEGLDDGTGFWILDTVSDATDLDIPTLAYIASAGLVLAGLALWVMWQPERRRLTAGALLLAAAGMLLLSPSYPWYFGWLLPMLCLVPQAWPLFWLVGSSFLLYYSDWDDVISTEHIVYGGTFLLIAAAILRWGTPLMLRRRRRAPLESVNDF